MAVKVLQLDTLLRKVPTVLTKYTIYANSF
jgi:hypothetical protein